MASIVSPWNGGGGLVPGHPSDTKIHRCSSPLHGIIQYNEYRQLLESENAKICGYGGPTVLGMEDI